MYDDLDACVVANRFDMFTELASHMSTDELNLFFVTKMTKDKNMIAFVCSHLPPHDAWLFINAAYTRACDPYLTEFIRDKYSHLLY